MHLHTSGEAASVAEKFVRAHSRFVSPLALAFVPAERIVVAPDCGLKYLARDVAYGKMRAMVEGAAIGREEILQKPKQATQNATQQAAVSR